MIAGLFSSNQKGSGENHTYIERRDFHKPFWTVHDFYGTDS